MTRNDRPNRVVAVQAQKNYQHVLVLGETVEYACKTVRDLFIVTSRRILNVDKQGLTGSKKNYDSIAFNKVSRFSVEFGGKLAGIVTVRIWSPALATRWRSCSTRAPTARVSRRCLPPRFFDLRHFPNHGTATGCC